MKYERGDKLLHNGQFVEIVDRDPHSRGYLVITLEDKGKVGGIQELIVPEHAEKVAIKASNNPFAKVKEASEVPSIVPDYEQYQKMMDHSFWTKEKDLIKLKLEPNWFQKLIMRIFL